MKTSVTTSLAHNKGLPNDNFNHVSTRKIQVLHVNAIIQINANKENDCCWPLQTCMTKCIQITSYIKETHNSLCHCYNKDLSKETWRKFWS